jgi:hypothetical protein
VTRRVTGAIACPAASLPVIVIVSVTVFAVVSALFAFAESLTVNVSEPAVVRVPLARPTVEPFATVAVSEQPVLQLSERFRPFRRTSARCCLAIVSASVSWAAGVAGGLTGGLDDSGGGGGAAPPLSFAGVAGEGGGGGGAAATGVEAIDGAESDP